MYKGEIFAYPFLAMDVTCRYVPYLDKVSEALPHLQPLKEMRHCSSVMHAKAHNTKCEVRIWKMEERKERKLRDAEVF